MIDELALRNELSKMFSDGWAAADWTSVQNAIAPAISYDGHDRNTPVDMANPHVKFYIEPAMSSQSSLTGSSGTIKWKNTGLICVQAFGALARGDGLEVANYMAIIAKRIYQGKVSPNGVWFRNCNINRIGTSGGWFQFNTLIEFEYDELR